MLLSQCSSSVGTLSGVDFGMNLLCRIGLRAFAIDSCTWKA